MLDLVWDEPPSAYLPGTLNENFCGVFFLVAAGDRQDFSFKLITTAASKSLPANYSGASCHTFSVILSM